MARDLGDPWLVGVALGALGTVATQPEEKRAFWQEGATYMRRVGDLALCSVCLASRAVLELEEEHFDQAAALLEEAIAAVRGDRCTAPPLLGLGRPR